MASLLQRGHRRFLSIPVVLSVAAALVVAIVAIPGTAFGRAGSNTKARPAVSKWRHHHELAPIGIVSAEGSEQAPILAEMKVQRSVEIDGYTFWIGTIAGRSVVDTVSGEADETAELATYILDRTFHPMATLFSGTAGAQDAAVHVGDVVTSGFVVDKSAIHYELAADSQGPYVQGYGAEQMHLTAASDIQGDIVTGYGRVEPTPADASTYNSTSPAKDKTWVTIGAFASPFELVHLASQASGLLGTDTVADATGDSTRTGTITNQVFAGVIGQAPVWTEPLEWIAAQNALYPSDAEENEGNGFAFANTQLGVPWLLVRGISDSVWYPNAFDEDIAVDHAAAVDTYIIENLPAVVSTAPTTLAELNPKSNAVLAGYLIAKQAYFDVTPVTKIVYVNSSGQTVTLTGAALASLESEYTYAAGAIG